MAKAETSEEVGIIRVETTGAATTIAAPGQINQIKWAAGEVDREMHGGITLAGEIIKMGTHRISTAWVGEWEEE